MTMLEFIEARLAEDEQLARSVEGPDWYASERQFVGAGDGKRASKVVAHVGWDHDRAHIARHDPARVLREVQAKRRLLAYLTALEEKALDNNWWNLDTYEPFQLLATAWSEHPDYDPTWSPT